MIAKLLCRTYCRFKLICSQSLLAVLAFLVSSHVAALALVTYPHATLLFEQRKSVDDYRLTLGNLKKIDSRWRADREQRLTGDLHSRTFELSEDNSAKEVFNYYRKQLLQLGGRELFYCESRNCGSSNAWANTRFHVKQLYGLDSDQYYSSFEIIEDNDLRSYVALYAVRRGNNRNYVQLDVLQTRETPRISSSVEAIEERLREQQSFTFVDAILPDGGLEEGHLKSLQGLLRRHRTWVIGLVGHNYAAQPLAEQQRQSLAMVVAIKEQLLASGVEADRVQVFGLGGLVPAVRLGKREALFQVVLISGL